MEVPQILSAAFQIFYLILKTWWWLCLPIILYFPLKSLYFWWVRWDVWYKEQKWVSLEIKPPSEIKIPFRAMEDVHSAIWGIYDSPNWREQWLWGEHPLPYWISWEIVSIEGEIHFYIRTLQVHRDKVEAAIYAHYPDAEISQVDDYTANVPQDIPNKDWDMYGEGYQQGKEDYYPIKTYPKFFEEKIEVKEEKRIDPILSLLETMTELGPGEQFWFQIIALPITNKEIPYTKRGKEAVDKMARRPPKRKPKSIVGEAAEVLITGKPPGLLGASKEEVPFLAPEISPRGEAEMVITPGEREIITEIEKKVAKYAYRVTLRGIYLARRDSFSPPRRLTARAYFNHFSTANLNFFIYWPRTRTRVHYWARKVRLYLRKKRFFKNYIRRFPPAFPFHPGKGAFVLNVEELATIYHFPYKIVIPGVPRVEAKKGGPPSIPTE